MSRKKADTPTFVVSEKPKKVTGSGTASRRFTPQSYVSRRLRLRAERKVSRTSLPNGFTIMARAVKTLTSHWEVFGGIVLIYAVLNLILVGGFSSEAGLEQLESNITDVFSGQLDKLATGLTIFAFFVQSGSTVAGGVASAYQTLLLLIISLAIVWALRQFYGGNKIRIRDAFYNGMYPLVQVLLVILMIFVHLLPALVGGFLFSTLVLNGIIIVAWQQVVVSIISLVMLAWTLYLLCASVFAPYIATLPEMTPLGALRSAKEIVRHRRGMILRKLLLLPLLLLLAAAIVMVPTALLVTTASAPLYFVLSVLCVPLVHAYMYTLYRSLIDA